MPSHLNGTGKNRCQSCGHSTRQITLCYRCDPISQIRYRFTMQRLNAAQRGILWLLTFEQWWDIWQQSGKWHLRGTRVGQYVMARKRDRGAYKVGNVEIITVEQNHSYASKHKTKAHQAAWLAGAEKEATKRRGAAQPVWLKKGIGLKSNT